MKTMSRLFGGVILLSLTLFPLGLSGAAPSPAPGSAPGVDPTTAATPDAHLVTPIVRAKLSQLHDPEAIRQLLYPSPLPAQEGVVRYPVSQKSLEELSADLAKLYEAHQLTVAKHPVVGPGLQMEGAAAQAFRGLGLKSGDLLVTLNGCTFMNADEIPTLLDVLSRARVINVRAVRGDELIEFHYSVENG
jgi:hypothetical protein